MNRSLPIAVLLAALSLALPQVQDKSKRKDAGPEVGQKAPWFKLNDHTGRAVDFRGKTDGMWTALAFYPKAATPG